ncbi:hypothetical protein [Sinorhizobium meliloti]|uniref:hypothetical protein n=1 Tax=Rhizobium meliloti TaxID=382 RepID=UPI000FD95AFE|nr:hypothetical protein [Sinorhizobium meliloti]RVG52477.1 hypothetical protein CN222_37445 [Sinorhizobium meliloti]RVM11553.1 hypothetical protein CN134_21910 [Sinorhizobium meliloti]RVO20684.1 hypothetical protein CN098_34670 [Sinorhizobium meliloti]RVO50463.1 hypothetical protein CN092_26600 [Sinorhizobium meliloti]
MVLTGLPPPASLAKMEKRYPVDWKFTQVHPVLIALGRELGGRRLHPSLLRGFESRTDIIADHVSSIRHIRGEDLGRRKGFYQITIEGPRFSGTWNFFSGELEDLVSSITPA